MKFHHVPILMLIVLLGWLIAQSPANQTQDENRSRHYFDQLKQGQSVTLAPAGEDGVVIKWDADDPDAGELKVVYVNSEFVDLEAKEVGDRIRLSKYSVMGLRMTKGVTAEE